MRIRNRRRPGQIRTRRMHVERLEERQLLSIVPGLLATGICDNEGDVFGIDVDYQDLGNSDVEYLGRLTGPTGYEDLTVRDIAYSFSGDTFYGIGDDVYTYPPYTPVGWPSLLATADVDIVTPPPSGEIGFTILGGLLNPEQDMSGQLLPVWANALEVNPANGKLYAAGAHMEVGLPPTSNHYAIYEVDVASATGSAVPATPVVDLGAYQSAGDIACDDDGYLYLTTTDSTLLKIDVLSATPSIVGEVVTDTGYGDFDGLTRGFGGGEFFGFRHDGTVYAFDAPGNDSTQVGSEALTDVELDDLYGATVAFMDPVEIDGPIDGLELVDQQPMLGQLWYEFQADNDGDLSVDLTAGGTLMTLYGYDAVGEEWVELDSDAMEVGISDAEAGETYVLHVDELTGEADLRFHNGAGTGVIGEFVWNDLNADGIQQVGEPGVENVEVELFDAGPDGLYGGGDDVSMGTDATDTNGFYGFGGLPAGTYYLEFSNLPAGCAFTLQDVGADDAVDSDVYQAGFLAGLTDVFALGDGAIDDSRDAGIVNAFSSPTVIPGPVEFEVLEDQVPDAYGRLRYQFTASREGMVSARVDYAGDCLLALYDDDQNLLHLDTSGMHQVDYAEAYADDVFYLHVAGLASPADVIIANLLEYDTGTGSVTVHGTDGPDEFTGVYGATPNPHEMWINGFYYDSDWFFFELNEIAFDGAGGDDSAVIVGSDQSDEGVVGPYSATMYANGDAASHEIKLEVSNTESIDVDAAGGEDTGTLNGGAGVETLDLWPGYCEWEGNPFTHIVRNVEILTAEGGGGDDTASMRDSAGVDDFEADPDSATLSGPGYTHTVNDFRWVHAFASDDGHTDTAVFEDLAGHKDRFRSWATDQATEAKMWGLGFFNRAKGFDDVRASASDLTDVAELHDSPGADTFEAYADRGTMSYANGQTVRADDFRWLFAYGSDDGQTDTAHLYDTTADLGTSYATWFKGFDGMAKL
ncbi:MAG TPA: SdrD B-like domain-containing protein, partial [Thermoguttaceae bacterium]|nr:SdrD B-like domain-containing protein [Thermoguttaceae bacterium]